MSQLTFNIFIISISLVVIITLIVLLPREFDKTFSNRGIIFRTICILLALAIFLLMICSIDYTNSPCISGKLVDIQQIGSFGGYYDRYIIKIENSNNKIYKYESVLSIDMNDNIDDLNIGDSVNLYGSTIINAFFYRIEKVWETEGTDNQRTVPWLVLDVNKDTFVDILDLIKLKNNLINENGYDRIADIDSNGVINSLDCVFLKKHLFEML